MAGPSYTHVQTAEEEILPGMGQANRIDSSITGPRAIRLLELRLGPWQISFFRDYRNVFK